MPARTEDHDAQRAGGYDQVYAKPERQPDSAPLGHLVTSALAGLDVIDTRRRDGVLDRTLRRSSPERDALRRERRGAPGGPIPPSLAGAGALRSRDAYQRRRLADGRAWEVRKNFPTAEVVTTRLSGHGEPVTFASMTYYWAATSRTPDGR